MKQVAVLGSTGSIGTNCLQVLAALPARLSLAGITAHGRWRELAEQTQTTHPRWAVVTDESLRADVDRSAFCSRTELLFGESGTERLCSAPEVDVVVSAIVGAAGLRGTWVALECGKTVAIANKETLVVAGSLVMELARRKNAKLLPVDSEHSAIFQALQAGQAREVRRVVLTSSGGPFRGRSLAQLEHVTPADALAHPTWNMGPKITIDSATMMNKALEVIEAKWLFGLRDDQIDVVVHPQSIVHSFVEFVDGSVIAQLSPPDMRLPIQYALTYPDRCESIAAKLDWRQSFDLHFEPPDLDAFPALKLGFEVASRGGTCGAVLNAANEAAVARFLAGSLRFGDISRACRAVLDQHDFAATPSLTELLGLDRWARQEVARWA
ncbi:MAG: 1-deoxy-D-xylulose-5-phosphate reductoisomerase [Planctomycetaceae bacterium]